MASSLEKETETTLHSLATVFRDGWYAAGAVCMILILLLGIIWIPNLSFLQYLLVSPSFSFLEKLAFAGSSFRLLGANFNHLSLALLVVIVALVSINTMLLWHYISHRIAVGKEAGIGALGMASGMLGIGCASCGSILLTYFLGIGATTRFFGLLPFHGYELQGASIVFLVASIVLTTKKIQSQFLCKR